MRSLPQMVSGAAYGFRALRGRNYRLYWFGQMASVTGTWMQDTALPLLVLQLTKSPLAFSLTVTIRYLPMLCISLFGGLLADRLPKRSTLITTQALQLIVALVLAVFTQVGGLTVALIYILVALRGTVDAVDMPTRQAFTVEMAGAEHLPNAVALNSAQFNTARIAGPAIAAALLLLHTLGMEICFYFNAASYLAVIVAYLLMKPGELFPSPLAPRENPLRQLAEGFRYAAKTPEILLVLVVMSALGTFGFNFQIIMPLVNEYVINGGDSGLGVLLAVTGVGSVIAGLFVAYAGKPSERRLLVSAAAFTMILFLIGLSHSFVATTVLAFFIGMASIIFMTAANTRLQLGVTGNMRGRVMGMYAFLFMGTTPIGSLLAGTLAEKNGVPLMTVELSAVCALGVVAGIWFALRKRSQPVLGPVGPAEE